MSRATALTRVVLAGVVALLGVGALSACGRPGPDGATDASETTDATWDVQALQAIGYSTDDLTVEDADDGPRQRHRFPRLRYVFRHTLHGEAVVQTEDGTKTVVVQRGEVTAVDDASITVKSSDGFTLTWQFGDDLRVIIHRKLARVGELTVGTEVGIAGAKEGDTVTARIIVVPLR